MELVSYPIGKAYEKGGAKVLLWSPKNPAGRTTGNLTHTAVNTAAKNKALVERHLELWNEKYQAKRNVLIESIYAHDIEIVDRYFVAIGYNQVNGFINNLQQKNPGYRFTHVKLTNSDL